MEPDDHPIGELLAAPVRAIQEAQIAAEREFVEFFIEYGLEPAAPARGKKGAGAMRVREVEFEMTRSVSDPRDPGTVVDRTATVRAPLLSLVNLPSLAIEEATVNLSLDVTAERTSDESKAAAARSAAAAAATLRERAAFLPQARREPVQLRGRVGNAGVARSLKANGRLEVTLKLVASRDQDALGRLATLLNDSLTARIDEER